MVTEDDGQAWCCLQYLYTYVNPFFLPTFSFWTGKVPFPGKDQKSNIALLTCAAAQPAISRSARPILSSIVLTIKSIKPPQKGKNNRIQSQANGQRLALAQRPPRQASRHRRRLLGYPDGQGTGHVHRRLPGRGAGLDAMGPLARAGRLAVALRRLNPDAAMGPAWIRVV